MRRRIIYVYIFSYNFLYTDAPRKQYRTTIPGTRNAIMCVVHNRTAWIRQGKHIKDQGACLQLPPASPFHPCPPDPSKQNTRENTSEHIGNPAARCPFATARPTSPSRNKTYNSIEEKTEMRAGRETVSTMYMFGWTNPTSWLVMQSHTPSHARTRNKSSSVISTDRKSGSAVII